jgi:hypothetical protein
MPFSVAQTAYEWPLGTSNLVHVNKASLSVASTTVLRVEFRDEVSTGSLIAVPYISIKRSPHKKWADRQTLAAWPP